MNRSDIPIDAMDLAELDQTFEAAVDENAPVPDGQYIVVVPGARLVAVRQIAERQLPDDKPWPYNYGEFTAHVLELAQALRAP